MKIMRSLQSTHQLLSSPPSRRVAAALATVAVCAAWMFQGAMAAEPLPEARNLSGIWWNDKGVPALKPVEGPIPLNAAGAKAYKRTAMITREIAAGPKSKGDTARCGPFGVPRVWTEPFPVQILQRPELTTIIYEHNRIFRLVYMNEPLPSVDEADPYYLGHAVGKWQDDTLVIESMGYNDSTVLDDTGLPHSDQLKIVERLRKIDGGKSLEVLATIEDPVFYSKPWTTRITLKSRPDSEIEEYICGEGVFDTRVTRAKAGKGK